MGLVTCSLSFQQNINVEIIFCLVLSLLEDQALVMFCRDYWDQPSVLVLPGLTGNWWESSLAFVYQMAPPQSVSAICSPCGMPAKSVTDYIFFSCFFVYDIFLSQKCEKELWTIINLNWFGVSLRCSLIGILEDKPAFKSGCLSCKSCACLVLAHNAGAELQSLWYKT